MAAAKDPSMLPVEVILEKEGLGVLSSTTGNCSIYQDGNMYYFVLYGGTSRATKTMIPINKSDYDSLLNALTRYQTYMINYPGKTAANLQALERGVRNLIGRFSEKDQNDMWDLLNLKRNELPVILYYDQNTHKIKASIAPISFANQPMPISCSIYHDSGEHYFVVSRGTQKTMILIRESDYQELSKLLDRYRSYGYDFGKTLQTIQDITAKVDSLIGRFKKSELDNINTILIHIFGKVTPTRRHAPV